MATKGSYVKPAPIGSNVITTDDVIASGHDFTYLKMGGMLKVPGASVDGDLEVGAGPAFELVPLKITTQPANKSVAEGADVTMTVAVTGGLAPYKYQWYKRHISEDEQKWPTSGLAVDGATAATLSLEDVTTDDAGVYFAQVRDNSDNLIVTEGSVVKVTESGS